MTDTVTQNEQPGRTVELVRVNLNSLSLAERKVAEAILRDPVAVIHLSISELAALADSSASSVVRMCVSIGLRGFQELKIRLARESFSTEKQLLAAIDPGDTPPSAARKVIVGTAAALEQAASVIDFNAVARIAEALRGAKRVLFCAVGTSSPVAADAAQRMVTIGIDARHVGDVHAQHVAARMLTNEDVLFVISHTGSTTETLAAARAAKAAGATVVALTSFSASPLTEISDDVLVAGTAETAYRVEAMASRIVHITVIDAIFVVLSLNDASAVRHQKLAADIIIEHRI
ncbi:MurR/RpiR family transcriptional regulator [Streptomyces sp. NPDC004752]